MIEILGSSIEPNVIANEYPPESLERSIIDKLFSSEITYRYSSLNHLKFELDMRINTIKAAKELNRSRMKFKVFKEAMCNLNYWNLTEKGGFLLKDDVKPVDGISDIFVNGSKYGTECSTAIIIIYYGALLKIYPKELFNITFAKLHLYDWKYIDDDLGISTRFIKTEHFPGDCRYFSNPEFNPEKSEWRGENTIDLGDGSYYGHGIGIKSAEDIIASLNKNRKPDSTKSAFLTNSVTEPNYRHLANLYLKYTSRKQLEYYRSFHAL